MTKEGKKMEYIKYIKIVVVIMVVLIIITPLATKTTKTALPVIFIEPSISMNVNNSSVQLLVTGITPSVYSTISILIGTKSGIWTFNETRNESIYDAFHTNLSSFYLNVTCISSGSSTNYKTVEFTAQYHINIISRYNPVNIMVTQPPALGSSTLQIKSNTFKLALIEVGGSI